MEKSDLELITSMTKDNGPETQAEFFKRYKSFLLQICQQRCKHFDGGDQLAEDIFQNTMIKAFKGIDSLSKRISEKTESASKHIKSWLVVIARNELREFLRKNPDEKKLANPFRPKSDEMEIPIETINRDDEIEEQPSFHKENLDKGLSILSVRERHILMVYMEYFNPLEPNRHLPDDIIAQLSKQYNTNSTNLRQIKSRALRKLMNELDKSK